MARKWADLSIEEQEELEAEEEDEALEEFFEVEEAEPDEEEEEAARVASGKQHRVAELALRYPPIPGVEWHHGGILIGGIRCNIYPRSPDGFDLHIPQQSLTDWVRAVVGDEVAEDQIIEIGALRLRVYAYPCYPEHCIPRPIFLGRPARLGPEEGEDEIWIAEFVAIPATDAADLRRQVESLAAAVAAL